MDDIQLLDVQCPACQAIVCVRLDMQSDRCEFCGHLITSHEIDEMFGWCGWEGDYYADEP
jgi:phage FluMu protein Com